MDWKKIKKFDGHVHVLPDEIREHILKTGDKEEIDFWTNANIDILLSEMDKNNVEKALMVPINSGRIYDMRKNNEFMAEMISRAPDRLYGFADVIIKDSYSMEEIPYEVEYAVKELGLSGVKIHPGNLNVPADDLRLVPLLRKVAELKIPVMYHSNPCGPSFYDTCTPERINRMIRVFPDVTFITAHMGGMRYLDAINAVRQVDISHTIFELVNLYGIETANRILRKFGVNRLIFATDFPIGYEKYFEILNQMDFTEEEAEIIAYKNISKILVK